MSRIQVAAAFIVENDRVLLAQRRLNDAHGGVWECPGGKLDAGETPAQAAVREIREELGLNVEAIGEPFYVAKMDMRQGASFNYDVHFVPCARIDGTYPKLLEAIGVGWFTTRDISLFTFNAAIGGKVLAPTACKMFNALDHVGAGFDWRKLR